MRYGCNFPAAGGARSKTGAQRCVASEARFVLCALPLHSRVDRMSLVSGLGVILTSSLDYRVLRYKLNMVDYFYFFISILFNCLLKEDNRSFIEKLKWNLIMTYIKESSTF